MEERKELENQQELLLVGDDDAQQQEQEQQYDDVLENNNNNSEEEDDDDEDDDEESSSSCLDIQIEQKRRELDLLQNKHRQDKQSQSDEIRQHQEELDTKTKSLQNKLKDLKSSITKITLLMKVAARQGNGLGRGGHCGNGNKNTIMMLVQDCLKEHYHTKLNQSSLPPMYVMNKEVALISALLINFKVLDNQIRIINQCTNNEDNLIPYLQNEKLIISNDLDKSISQSLEKLSKIAKQNTECYDEFQLQLDAIEWERIATLKLLTTSDNSGDAIIIKDKDNNKNTAEACYDDSSTVPLSDEDDTERSGWDEIVATSSHWLSSLPWAAGGGGGGGGGGNVVEARDDGGDGGGDDGDASSSSSNNNSINETSFHCDFAEEEETEGAPSSTTTTNNNNNNEFDDCKTRTTTKSKNDDNDSSNSKNSNPNHFAAFLNSSIDNMQKFTTTVVTETAATAAAASGGGGVGWLVGQQQQQQQQQSR